VGLEGAIAQHAPDVVVVDLVGPGRDAMEAIASVSAAYPACRVLAFSGHDDPQTRRRAAEAGAWSLVSKHDEPLKLLLEIRRAAAAGSAWRGARPGGVS
jgi:DNA-binding NarL/FixJ family response regulator